MTKSKMTSALIGKNLSYSLSHIIHSHYKNDNYTLIETDNFSSIFAPNNFNALSVTNPYKQEAYNHCTIHDKISKETGIVNTMIYKNGIWHGYNTDYYAFKKMLESYKITLTNKKILVIGNGSTSKTICYFLTQNNLEYEVIARHPKNSNEILLDKQYYSKNIEIIIQTTSYGVFPNLEKEPLLNYNNFERLEMIIDVNYNPRRPYINNHIKYYNGLLMLVYNGLLFEELFQNCRIEDDALSYCKYLDKYMSNIVLIGMPFSGKTTIGEKLSKILNKKFLDTDEILKNSNYDLNSCLKDGKDVTFFRTKETIATKKIASSTISSVISTGGGIILNDENMLYLKQNGVIIYLKATTSTLKKRCNFKERPLIKSSADIDKLYFERKKQYEEYADIVVDVDKPINEVLETIEVKLNEYFNN